MFHHEKTWGNHHLGVALYTWEKIGFHIHTGDITSNKSRTTTSIHWQFVRQSFYAHLYWSNGKVYTLSLVQMYNYYTRMIYYCIRNHSSTPANSPDTLWTLWWWLPWRRLWLAMVLDVVQVHCTLTVRNSTTTHPQRNVVRDFTSIVKRTSTLHCIAIFI